MNKIMKIIFTFIMTFVLISSVNALEVNYEWGKEFEDYDKIYDLYPEGDNFVADVYVGGDWYYDLFDDDMNFIEEYGDSCKFYYPEVTYDGESYYLDYQRENVSSSGSGYTGSGYTGSGYQDSSNYRYRFFLLSEDCNVEDTFVVETDDYFSINYVSKTEEGYTLIDVWEESLILVSEDLTSGEYYYMNEFSDNELKKYLGDYYYPVMDLMDVGYDNYVPSYSIMFNENNQALLHYIIERYNSNGTTYTYYMRLYNLEDGSYEKKSVRMDRGFDSYLTNDYVYTIQEEDISENSDCRLIDEYYPENEDEYCNSQFTLTIYNTKFDKVYEKQLQMLESDYWDYISVDELWHYGRDLYDFFVRNDSIYMITNYYDAPGSDASKDDYEHELTGYNPIVVKYSISYAIKPKDDGNGEIIIPEDAKPGDEVKFTIKPMDGFTIDNIKITDDDGNEIEHDGDSFIMPPGDINVIVTFKKIIINPDTLVFGLSIFVVLALAGGFVFIRNYTKLKWLK